MKVDEPETAGKEQNQIQPSVTEKKRRSFSVMAAAKAKIVQLPRQIPGVQSGSPPTISPSHPSHMQAIQKAPTAKWFCGRTDMWPIPFLEAADRQWQRGPTSSSSSRNHGNASSGTSRPPYPPPPHRINPPPVPPRPVVPPTAARQSSSTMQSFAPPANRTRPNEESQPPPQG